MPICRTCRGEYGQQEAVCPRCGSDVRVWDRFNTTLRKFVLKQGGVLGLLPSAAALAVWIGWVPPEDAGNYFPVLTLVCVGMCLLAFFLVYISYFYWWEQWWAQQIYYAFPISLTLLIVVTAIGGLLLTPLWVLYYTTVGRPVEFIDKALFAAIYVPAFVCLTTAVTAIVVSDYITRLEQSAPPPIFASTERLLRVVVDAAINTINLPGLNTRVSAGSPNLDPVYEVLQTLRIPENGGIHVLLRECKRVQYPGADGKMQSKPMEMLWQVQADRWGRLQVVRPGSLEPYDVDKRVFREIGRHSS